MRITVEMLREREACGDQMDIFATRWPDGVEVTEDAALEAVALGLDIDWAAEELLSAPAQAEYHRAIEPAWAEYVRVTAPIRSEFDRAIAPVWAEFDRAIAPAWAEFDRACARAFAAAAAMEVA